MKAVTGRELKWLLKRARTSRIRSMREFAEAEIIIPDGPYQGRPFDCQRQPYTRLWLESIDTGHWNRFVATGPTQSGKTLCCFLIPLLYHLFEVGETVICGLPDMDMAADKWREDLLPVIERSRYKSLMPKKGSGSRGGKIEAIQFLNGATLKFMSGGGGDKSRAGFTSRVVVITETDGMDQAGASSREADKVTQLEARTRAYGDRKRIYLECTVSTEAGRTWQEYQNGTRSQILLPCPHCHKHVAIEREQLVGWKEATTQAAAKANGAFRCPSCQQQWNETERTASNQNALLLHEGQSINESGMVTGDPKPTDTLGFRWSAVHNLFLSSGEIAADQWRASRSNDEDSAEREMRQFVWCLPVLPTRWDETALQAGQITRRVTQWPRGVLPPETTQVSSAIDLGKYLCHWVVVAWSGNATGHIVDYGRIEVASSDLGVEPALMLALNEYRDMIVAGYPKAIDAEDPSRVKAEPIVPQAAFIDAGYMTEAVYQFCRANPGFLPSVGRGATQQPRPGQQQTTSGQSVTRKVGEGYRINWQKAQRILLAEVNADHWKSWVHARLETPLDQPGAMTLFQLPPHEHLSLAKHLTAEKKTEEFVLGKGVVTRWERIRKNNHWFDALYNACAAGHKAGARLIAEQQPDKPHRKMSELQAEKRQQRNKIADRWQGIRENWRERNGI